MTDLAVAEHFYSIQGEGPHAGTPAVFLRLAGCNLSCGWHGDLSEYEPGDEPQGDAAWVCDTIDVWREADQTVSPVDLVDDWVEAGWLNKIQRGAHIVLTGGEPTLPAHQSAFVALHDELTRRLSGEPTVEVETNGTQRLTAEFRRATDAYNVSLKLSNSGMAPDRRLDADAIADYIARGDDTVFKFVIANAADVTEARDIIATYGIPDSQVSLMPAGQSREALRETYPLVADACKMHGYTFSPRLQVDTWGEVTGV